MTNQNPGRHAGVALRILDTVLLTLKLVAQQILWH